MIEDIDTLIENVRKYTESAVSQSRYEHSVRTAETSARYCRKYGLDEKLGYLAGIGHDMCKAMDSELLMSISARDGKPFSDIERMKPGLLHGRAAAVKMQEDFNITEPDVIEAVANHTFGFVGMCDLSKVLYVADKIEPGRDHVTEAYLKSLEKLTLDQLVLSVLRDNVNHLKKKNKAVAPETELLLKWLEERVNEKI